MLSPRACSSPPFFGDQRCFSPPYLRPNSLVAVNRMTPSSPQHQHRRQPRRQRQNLPQRQSATAPPRKLPFST